MPKCYPYMYGQCLGIMGSAKTYIRMAIDATTKHKNKSQALYWVEQALSCLDRHIETEEPPKEASHV